MIYVITSRCSDKIFKIGDAKATSLKDAKSTITKLLAERGFFPCPRLASNRGKWFHSVNNPHWVLRYQQKRYYRNVDGNKVCAYVLPKHKRSHVPTAVKQSTSLIW